MRGNHDQTADGEIVDFLITPLCRLEEALIVITIPNHPDHPPSSPHSVVLALTHPSPQTDN